MNFTEQEVMEYVRQEDVRFIRLAFCDVFGKQKNIAIMPSELERAFRQGIAIDASAIAGFGGEVRSDLFLHPDPGTLSSLPWRGENGKVVRMFCGVSHPDGTTLETDSRALLKQAVERADSLGVRFAFGTEMEFYLFKTDEEGEPTAIPYDRASYMDIAPRDKGENIRREICITLEQMGVKPECSHHEEGPGQNEIDFRFSNALLAADNVNTFQRVVKTVANRNGLCADFSPKPLPHAPGNGFHINMSLRSFDDEKFGHMIAGILANIQAMTAFFNPSEDSYRRLGSNKAPGYVSWSAQNRSQLVRIPAAMGEYRRAELRSPDPGANPYLAFALMIYAGLDGIKNRLPLPEPADLNLYRAAPDVLARFERLPESYAEACKAAAASAFIRKHVPERILEIYCGK